MYVRISQCDVCKWFKSAWEVNPHKVNFDKHSMAMELHNPYCIIISQNLFSMILFYFFTIMYIPHHQTSSSATFDFFKSPLR